MDSPYNARLFHDKDNLFFGLQRAQTCNKINITSVFGRKKSIFISNSYSNMKSMSRTLLIDGPFQSVCSISCPCPTLHGNSKLHHLSLKCWTDLTGQKVWRTKVKHSSSLLHLLEEQVSPLGIPLERVTQLQFYTGAG